MVSILKKLDIETLGGLSIKLDGEPVASHMPSKAQALLVYLACTQKEFTREHLAELFWEERTSQRSLTNLRVVLTNLRKQFDQNLRISRKTISLATESQIRIDVHDFERSIEQGDFRTAAALYKGDFLESFYLRSAGGFEQWAELEKARLHQSAIIALHKLLDSLMAEGKWIQGIKYANRLIEWEPFDENAHQKLMQLLFQNNQRTSALSHFDSFRRLLKNEMGIDPDSATTALYEQIRTGTGPGTTQSPRPPQESFANAEIPAFLESDAEQKAVQQPLFVAREHELSALNLSLEGALSGDGGILFVTGDAGRGKTAILNEFAIRAVDNNPELLVLKGTCNAFSGIGDPYLPFREIIGMLAGDLESAWRAGTLNHVQTLRLWDILPDTSRALMQHCPDLLRSIVNVNQLLLSAQAFSPYDPLWMEELQKFAVKEDFIYQPLEQLQFFQQLTNLLLNISNAHPLLIVLDDMQWADTASVSLLFHIGRRLEGTSILVACAYRPEEISLGRNGERHPLEKVLSELKRQYGDVWLDLAKVQPGEAEHFVDQYLDQESNRLDKDFRRTMIKHTAGHPLFIIELLKEMQAQNYLVYQNGQWTASPALDWELLPARVEGVIEERLGRLDNSTLDMLKTASVEGDTFTAQVIARVHRQDERQVVRILSSELGERHQLVQERGLVQATDKQLARFQFTHTMFQSYLYEHLAEHERQLLHEDVGGSLEELYRGQTDQVAVRLAHHFIQGSNPSRALPYLIQAGDQARKLYANLEAEQNYLQAAEIQTAQGLSEETARTYLKLGLVYTAAYQAEKAQTYYDRAFDLWSPLRDSPELSSHKFPSAVLRFAMEEPRTIDPGLAEDDISAFFVSQIFEGLVRIGRDYNVLPAAAERWEMNEDGTCYTFHLREGAIWNDDSFLTAYDFINAWKRNLRLHQDTGAVNLLYAIKNARAYRENDLEYVDQIGLRAEDDLILQVTLEEPTPYFPYLLAHPIFYPLPMWVIDGLAEDWTLPENIITNGPYEITAWIPGEIMRLAKNPLYHGEHAGNILRAEIRTFESIWPALDVYNQEDLDMVCLYNADPGTISKAMNTHRSEVVTIPRPSTVFLSFRCDQPPFDDVRVRQAFVHAVDRRRLASEASQGLHSAATGGFVPPGMVGHSPDIGLPFDPELASRLLSDAGYPSGSGFPEITWLQPTASEDERIVPFLCQAWSENLGLDLDTVSLEWPEFYERFTNDPANLTIMGWGADYPDPDNMLRVTFHSREGLNTPRWSNRTFDTLVENAKRVTDHDQRMQLYHQADCILVAEQAAIMPVGYSRSWMLVKPWVSLPQALSIQMPLNRMIIDRNRQRSAVEL